ncbi:hypothetical protein ACP4OV_015160 [Aristida adscensionis]
MAAPHGNIAPAANANKAPSSASQELYLTIYQRCLLNHVLLQTHDFRLTILGPDYAAVSNYSLQLSILDTEILRLERASCSELLEEVMLHSEGSSYSGLLDEIENTRAKRARIYREFQRNLQQIQDCRDRN